MATKDPLVPPGPGAGDDLSTGYPSGRPDPSMDSLAVSGLGVCCSIGNDVDAFRAALATGAKSFRAIDEFATTGCRTVLAGFCGALRDEPTRSGARASGFLHRAVEEAMAGARLHERLAVGALQHARIGVVVGTSLGGMGAYVEQFVSGFATDDDGIAAATPLNPHTRLTPDETVLSIPANLMAWEIARAHGFGAGVGACVTACSAGANAIAIGADMIRLGRADVVVAAGVDTITPLTFAGFHCLKALTRGEPTPFDRDRGGLLVGEGAGALVLERPDTGVHAHARLAGYGLANDAFHVTQPHPQGRGAALAMRQALADADLAPDRVGYVNMHGTGTRYNDQMELEAMRDVFGERAGRIPISSIKGAIGHTLGAAGAIEAVATVLALRDRLLPANVGFHTPMDGATCDVVVSPRPAPELAVAMSNSFAFGGNCASLVFECAA